MLCDTQALQYKCQLTGHSSGINRICMDKQNRCVYTASRDKTVRQYNLYTHTAPVLSSGALPQQPSSMCYAGHTMNATALAVNQVTHSAIVSGARNYNIFVHDVTRSDAVQQLPRIDQNVVTALQYVPTSADCIVQTSEDLVLRMYDLRTNAAVWSVHNSSSIPLNCSITPDGHTVVTAHNGFDGSGCELNSYDLRTQRHMQLYRGHTEAVSGLCCINSQYVCSSSKDSTVKLWDISGADPQCISRVTVPDANGVPCVTGYMDDNGVICVTAGTVSGRIAAYEFDLHSSSVQLQYDSAVVG